MGLVLMSNLVPCKWPEKMLALLSRNVAPYGFLYQSWNTLDIPTSRNDLKAAITAFALDVAALTIGG